MKYKKLYGAKGLAYNRFFSETLPSLEEEDVMGSERKDIKYQLQQGYKLQTLMHRVNCESLRKQHDKQSYDKAEGIDKMTKDWYTANLENNINDLIHRMKNFSYKPKPVKRTYIPKANGKLRPLGIPSYEDKLVQGVMAEILVEIYENIFLDFSYGFRPERSCHDATAFINHTIMTKKVNYIVDADIKGFFDNVNHDILIKMLEVTIADKNFIRYIIRFLKSGYMENGRYYDTLKGTPQGGLISPVLANVYLHYVLDKWFESWIKPRCKGEVYMVRYADDFLVMFQYENEARSFLKVLDKRFKQFGLELENTKTRLLPFGRFKGNKDSFDFLGFRFINGKTRTGKYRVVVKTSKKKLKQKKAEVSKWLHDRMHNDIFKTLEKIKLKVIGHYAYYGINGNFDDLNKFYKYVKYKFYKVLTRRGQKHAIPYKRYLEYWNFAAIPKPMIFVNIW